jgi:hypothetical protein
VRLRLFRAHRRLRDGLRDRMRQKQQRAASSVARSQMPKTSKSKESAELLSISSQAQYACGD